MKIFEPWDLIAWFNALFYIVCKLPLKALAPIAVLFVDRKHHPVWGIEDAKEPVPYWEAANPFGNACHNFGTRARVQFNTLAGDDDHTLEQNKGFQWRLRRSKSGAYISFRCTWGEPSDKGKREFYIGWTMNERTTMRPTLQVRL